MAGTKLLLKDFICKDPYAYLIHCSANSVNISENYQAKNVFMKGGV